MAVSLLRGTDEIKTEEKLAADYDFLKNIFKSEFVYDHYGDVKDEIADVIAYFLDANFIMTADTNGGYKLTRLGYDKLPIWAALAKTFLESYWIASRSFIQEGNKAKKGGDLLKNMNYLGLRFHKLGLIDHIEAVSQINFRNAIHFINENIPGAKKGHDGDKAETQEKLSMFSQRVYDLSHFKA
jgi:hypothetical protein